MRKPLLPPLPTKPTAAQGRSWLATVLIAAACGGGIVALSCGGLMCGGLLLLRSASAPQAVATPVPSTLPAGYLPTPPDDIADPVPGQASPTEVSAEERPEVWPFPSAGASFVDPSASSEAQLRDDDAEAAATGVLGAILGNMFGGDEDFESLSEEEQIEQSTREFEERQYYRDEYYRARAERERED